MCASAQSTSSHLNKENSSSLYIKSTQKQEFLNKNRGKLG